MKNRSPLTQILALRAKHLTALWLKALCITVLGFSGMYANAVSAAEQLYTKQPTVTPELADTGSLKVGVKTITAVNPNQLSAADFTSRADRSLTLEVWYPANVTDNDKLATYRDVTRNKQAFELQGDAFRDAAPLSDKREYPLVVFSHGYTGYRTIMFYLAEHLASHGYVVVGIDHTDSTNAEVDFDKNQGSGFASTLLNRARDQQFVLDYFGSGGTPLSKIADVDQASVLGYSMGGYGAINTVGGCYSFSEQILQAFGMPAEHTAMLQKVFNSCNAGRERVDPRWKAMIAMAPWGGEPDIHEKESLANIKIPMLYVTGDQDDIVGYENGVKKLFENTGSDNTYMLVYENARHNFPAHPAPKSSYANDLDIGHYYEPAWDLETLNRINEHMTLAFLDCHVKKRAKSCGFLPARENITQVKQADGKLTPPWPGFKDRWGTGVRFVRKQP